MEGLFLISSFLIGSIPFGYIIVKKKTGKDIRKEGSGNIGSTNVKRIAGKKISLIVQMLDVLKGLIPVLIYNLYSNNMNSFSLDVMCYIALASIIGHIYSPFLKFKGGKGINTTLGSFILICPIPVILSIIVHLSLKIVTNITSIRSIILSIVIPLCCYILKYNPVVIYTTIVVSILIIIAHRDNVYRLIKGEES